MSSAANRTKGSRRGSARREPWQRWCASKRERKRLLSQNGGKGRQNRRKSTKRKRRKPLAKAQEAESQFLALQTAFHDLTDPRVNRRRRHLLTDIVFIAICSVIGGAENWKDMQVWGESHVAWLRRFLELPNGIPSRDTFRRVISRLKPKEFGKCFTRWLQTMSRHTQGRIVALDGKTIRRSMDSTSELKPLHVVSAWASEQHLTLGQVAVDKKSNEITAIPKLLELIELEGALITIDAMGCQKAIARQIVDGKGDFCLAVKGNQGNLEEDLGNHFEAFLSGQLPNLRSDEYSTKEKGHGREDRREYYITDLSDRVRNPEAWAGLKTVGMAVTYRSKDDDPDVRYYITSIPVDAKRFAWAVRHHWGIENSLHWIMDVTFDEDHCRIHKDHGAENVSWMRRIAISLLKNEPTLKDTVRAKRMRAGWDIGYLEKVIATGLPEN